MDETGMSDADKIEFVDDVLLTWGEEAAQELAERYGSICRRSSTNTGTWTRRHDTKLASSPKPLAPRFGGVFCCCRAGPLTSRRALIRAYALPSKWVNCL